jgi:uncharacterized membrane protein YdbT with pleckstrin-like domain
MRASPKFLKYRLVLLALGAVGALGLCGMFVIIAAVSGDAEALIAPAILFPVAVVGAALGWVAIRIDYALRYYVLTDRSLRVRSGAFVVREQTLTYANVQNLDLHQGPIQRWLGISDLRIDVAGGGASQQGKKGIPDPHGAKIAGVENAREIREQISELMRLHGGSGLGDPDDPSRPGRSAAASPALVAVLREVAAEARGLAAAAKARGPAAE